MRTRYQGRTIDWQRMMQVTTVGLKHLLHFSSRGRSSARGELPVDAATWGLLIATFVACFVEMVEATTIVMAMGFTRSWRSAVAGTLAALGALAVVTAFAGYALANWLPEAALQLAIGSLLLIFGLQWLRKAILRSSGRKALHNEDAIYREEAAAAKAAGRGGGPIDMFSFMV